jgi:hypothetical protein
VPSRKSGPKEEEIRGGEKKVKNEIVRVCRTLVRGKKNRCKISVGKTDRKRPLG